MERYANGKIYKLVNNTDKEIYIGSTCVPFHKRLYWHKKAAKRVVERKVYKHLNEIGWDDVQIILIESFPCENKMELEKRERYWIEQLHPSLNTKLRPYITEAERKAQDLATQKIYGKMYRALTYTCELCQTTFTLQGKARHIRTTKHQNKLSEQTKQKDVVIDPVVSEIEA